MCAGDLPAVLHVAKKSMANPWGSSLFESELALTSGVRLVAGKGEIYGYVIFRVIDRETELLQLAVLPSCRRQGIGSQLLAHGFKKLYRQQARVCFLEVRRQNRAGRLFYHKAGFQPVGIRKRYYRRPSDDAVIMRKILDEDSGDADTS